MSWKNWGFEVFILVKRIDERVKILNDKVDLLSKKDSKPTNEVRYIANCLEGFNTGKCPSKFCAYAERCLVRINGDKK